MTLLSAFLLITAPWADVFPQQRTFRRALRQALGCLLCMGRRCVSRIIWTLGGEQQSWSADYFLYSRCQWDPQHLFRAMIQEALPYCPQRLIGIAIDDTRLRKTGRCIPQAFYQRDPMSPPFHTNLILGLRFLQASVLLPLHRSAGVSARAVPIRFEEVSRIKRPGKKASEEMKQQYRQAVKQYNLSRRFVQVSHQLRAEYDLAGAQDHILVLTVDNSYCNRTCFADVPPRCELLARARQNSKLCFRAPAGSRRFYALEKFTPEQVRQEEKQAWKIADIFYGGERRNIRYKEVSQVYWQSGAKKRPLRLLVVAPTPYRKSKNKRLYYRDPAYLLTTDLASSAEQLLQIYFDRWQIEVNHREEKDTLGVGQAQLRNATAVAKQPVLGVAAYSALLLASLRAFGPERGAAYPELPKWRRNASRPSCLDLLTVLRKEVTEQPDLLAGLGLNVTKEALVNAAAA